QGIEKGWAAAVEAYQRGEVEPLIREFGTDAARDSVIGDYVRYLLADALARVDDFAGARAAALSVADKYPTSRLVPRALLLGAAGGPRRAARAGRGAGAGAERSRAPARRREAGSGRAARAPHHGRQPAAAQPLRRGGAHARPAGGPLVGRATSRAAARAGPRPRPDRRSAAGSHHARRCPRRGLRRRQGGGAIPEGPCPGGPGARGGGDRRVSPGGGELSDARG